MQVAIPTPFRLAGLLAIDFSIARIAQSGKWLSVEFWLVYQPEMRQKSVSFLSPLS